jgi:tetratricopeptide (TPR) repeat protein
MVKIAVFILLIVLAGGLFYKSGAVSNIFKANQAKLVSTSINKVIPHPSPIPNKLQLIFPASSKVIPNSYHVFQSFNNCGPAALSIALSYYGISKTQQELGQILRPYQVPSGDNDDKSVTLEELAEHSKQYDLIPYLRPNGSIDKIKLFISYDIPVITRTWLKENDDIGHYRIVKGYNNSELIQDDSLQGKNLSYGNEEFLNLWEKFNYEYLVLVPKDKKEIAEAILGEDIDEKTAFQKSLEFSQSQLRKDPNNIYAKFNESITYYHLGEYQNSVKSFEEVEDKLPFRTLWYQIEPILSYQKLKKYDRVFEITDKILNNQNRAFSELYQIRGEIFQEQGKTEEAKSEFEKAIQYNGNFEKAEQSLKKIS